ncbi:MAG: sugar phosphate isomerase/epimerase, partial [Gemmatales bacterium]|nr:sugar phosphate isomerase/epimerase [Gemmatales bacterium]MDW8385918.1 sugar phosphate isomerase/epimerase family protein [Gemmatales bacterium]
SCFASAVAASLGASTVHAIDPIQRRGRPRFRLSIAAYSFRQYLDLKKPSMTLEDFVDLAADLDLDAVEPTAYYFADTSLAYLTRLRNRCIRLGLDISGGAVGNNFCHADPLKLRDEVTAVKLWIERYSILGAKTIRIFAGSAPSGEDLERVRARCVAAIQEVCDHAARFGIYLALENHGGITSTPDQILAIVQAVRHDWFGVNLDTGNFRTEDPYADLARIAPYAVNVQLKTEIQRKGKPKEEADLERLLDILRQVNYRGYIALEYEAAEDPKTAVPRYVAQLRKLIG